ncbi:MAG TPA: hypothetical protein VII94_01875 [Candidatus Saccharimonadales bacterium]
MRAKKISIYLLLSIIILLIAGVVFSYFSPLPSIKTVAIFKPTAIDNNQPITWPSGGSQAIGIVGYGIYNQSGALTPSPVASTIKVLLALSVLNEKPLGINQEGPNIVISQSDVNDYNTDLSLDESVVKVQSDEIISEYQALQALLIASSNNFAQILVNWAFGSTTKYLVYANRYAKSLGMDSTIISDDSGYSILTTSNAVDLVTLGQKAITNPVIASIVSQYTATIPVVGKIVNYNSNLNPIVNNQIDGIKTGNTTQGGGNYIYSSTYLGYKIVGSIVGAQDLNAALVEGPKTLDTYEQLIKIQNIILKNQVVGYYDLPWGNKIYIYSKNNLYLPIEPNIKYSIGLNLSSYSKNQSILNNYLTIKDNKITNKYPLAIQNTYKKPSLWWLIKYNLKKLPS